MSNDLLNDQTPTEDEDAGTTRRMDSTKPRKATKARERKRRDYAGELAELQARVTAAMKLLRRCTSSDAHSPAAKELIGIAIETLNGE